MYSALIEYPRARKRKGLPYYFAPGHPDRIEEERRAMLRQRRAKPKPAPRSEPQPTLF